jgi:RNA polymerase sigma-B factor
VNTSRSSHDTVSARAERDQRTVALLVEASQVSGPQHQVLLDAAVELNIGMARRLASHYFRRGMCEEDLEQVACLALVKAVHGFDATKSECFAPYAITTIRGELRRHFRDAGWTVRPPRRVQELHALVHATRTALTQELNRAPTVQEVADAVGADPHDVLEASDLSSCFRPASIDATTSVDRPQTLGERLAAADSGFPAAEARLMLAPLVARLPDRERQILQLRFFEQLTQQEIGDRLGISQMQISRILSALCAQLRTALGGTSLSSVA